MLIEMTISKPQPMFGILDIWIVWIYWYFLLTAKEHNHEIVDHGYFFGSEFVTLFITHLQQRVSCDCCCVNLSSKVMATPTKLYSSWLFVWLICM